MDPRLRADETLARARARGAFVVTPDSATSPMDASTTLRIPRETMPEDPNSTLVLRGSEQETTENWPTTDQGEGDRTVPPNPYDALREPHQFGPLGSQAAQQYPQY